MGLLIVSLVIWLFMDWLDIGCAEEEKGIVWLRNRFFYKKGVEMYLPGKCTDGKGCSWD